MKYFHFFNERSNFNVNYNDNYLEPWVSFTSDGGAVHYNKDQFNGHPYVDLGLPSGTLWATYNIGAVSPEDYGVLLSWGENAVKESFSWSDYEYGTENNITKYNDSDGKTVIDPHNDIAYIIFGGSWRTPTSDNISELIEYTTLEEGQYNGVDGVYLTSKVNGQYIFLPYAGEQDGSSRTGIGDSGVLWTANRVSSNPNKGICVSFNEDGIELETDGDSRNLGFSIRPVILGEDNVEETSIRRFFAKSKNMYTDSGELRSDDYYCIIVDEQAGQTLNMRMITKKSNGAFISTTTSHDCITTGMQYNVNDWKFYYYSSNTNKWMECNAIVTDIVGQYTWESGNDTYKIDYVEIYPQDGTGNILYGIKNLYKNDVLIEEYINLIWEPVFDLTTFSLYWRDGGLDGYNDPNYGVCEAVILLNKSSYYIPV